jgi:hypothetical protein
MLKRVVDCLNRQKIRATYGAVGKLCGVEPLAVGPALGDRSPWASWVVSATNGQPTGYSAAQKDPDLNSNPTVIRDSEALRRLLKDC